MKLKKIFFIVIISLFCFVPIVKAKDDIVVESIKIVDSSDEVLNSIKKINIEFNDLDQYAIYKVKIKNNSKKDLYANNLQVDGSSQNFIRYTLDEKSRSNNIKAGNSGEVIINVFTKNEKGAGKNLSDNISFKLLLNEKIVNPNTNSNLISTIILIIISAIAITFIMTKFSGKKGTIATVIVCFMLLGTSFVFADDTVVVNFKGKVKYSSQNLLETTGTTILNHKANYTSSKDIWTYSNQVKNINISTENNNIETYAHTFDITINDKQRVKAYLVANGDQNIPYDLYIVSNGVIYAPEDSTGLFSFPNVETINGLENVMFDNTTKMTGMFIGNQKLNTVDLSTVDTSKVKDTSYMFHKCLSLNVDKSKFNLENTEIKNNMFVQYIEDEIIKDAKTDKDIKFSQISSSTNGQGLYIRSGTENNKNPIYYYRGNVTNNNLIFANKCWKIVRTTETGGIKLIYNGVPKEKNDILIGSDEYINISNDKTYPFTYNISTYQWVSTNKSHSKSSTISFNVKKEGNYILNYEVSSESCCDKAYFYKDGSLLGSYGNTTGNIQLGKLTPNNTISVKYTKDGSVSSGTDNVKFDISIITDNVRYVCNNTGTASQIGTSIYNSSYNSPAYVGYMYGSSHSPKEILETEIPTGIVYGNDIEYRDGKYYLKDKYTLQNGWSTDYDTITKKYHYTCFSTSDSCEKVNYIYYVDISRNPDNVYYFELTSGKTHLDLLDEMLKNSTNENNSAIKTYIDDWYSKNMIDYTNYLEDTVWCNDRSISELGGFDKNEYASRLVGFGGYDRIYSNSNPSLDCKNPNDRFTVSSKNGNGKLTYPVALLTADEQMLAGSNINTFNSNYYLYTGTSVWNLTPCAYNKDISLPFYLINSQKFDNNYATNDMGIRPAISLKSGIDYTSGTGTITNPYVIE